LKSLVENLNEEWQYRYDHTKNHKSFDVVMTLPEPNIDDVGITPFPLCMPDQYKLSDAVSSYRNYYKFDKQHIHSWKKRGIPSWII
jgi:hypothetical protein